jgi:hypothetical protein
MQHSRIDEEQPRRFVHMLTVAGEPMPREALLETFRSRVHDALQRLDGFRGLALLLSLDERELCVVTEWTQRDAWGRAQWDADVQDIVVGLVQSATQADPRSYEVILRETGKTAN